MSEKLLKLKQWFKEQGLTQEQIGKRLNVSGMSVNVLLNGKRNFGVKSAMDWSREFGLNPMWLMTGEGEMLDVTEQAMELADDGVTLFPLPTNNRVNTHVRNIAAAAGIDKYITFHSARHTFATMLLTLGTDIYTVSKLLGHSDVKVTQIYAKVIDEAKRKAVGSIPDITGNKRVTDKSGEKGQE